ncbi:MAG: hypothetical protein Q4D54_10050 [Eubacteriales bacterium]|nr:hypothetical protein [Lachnospiraceae bacterium]MDO5128067.1 hypothetical protein [Eubacteriales bacterium]
MKLIINKKIEIVLLACNLFLFLIVNIMFMRVFHPVSVALMAILLLIEILVHAKKEYVKWEKKAPSVLPFLVICGICILCAVVSNFASIKDYVYVVVFLIENLCAMLAIIVFLRYIIIYKKAYRAHRKELELSKQQRLINSSISVLLFLGIVGVWIITVSCADRVAVVTSPKKYEKEISGTEYMYFPTSIPQDAKNERFYRRPGFWLTRDNTYVEFETSNQYLDEYESTYAANIKKVTIDNPWITHSDSCRICTYLEEHYLNHEKCDVYVTVDAYSVQGYAINRATNELFIFYDGRD